MNWNISARQAAAHRLHQFRVEARLTTSEVDTKAGWALGHCFAIEYKGVGTTKEINKAIALFVPGERRMRSVDEAYA